MNTNISSTDILDITILKRNQKRHNTIKYHLTFIAILCVLLFILAGELMGDVSIKVKERDGVTRSAEPVTMGIPFAKGELQSSTPVRITNGSGNTVDAQFMTMATWGDGSIKWLKCDFQAGVSANATATYTLKTGTSHNPSTELTVSESSGAITVTTGPLRFMVNKNAFNVLHRVYLDLDNNRQYTSGEEIITPGQSVGPIVTKGSADYKATANTPENIEIEEQGPMKVVIKVSGRHYRNSSYLLKYETRIYAYAGKPYIKLWHVYANGKTVDSLGDSMNPANGASFDRYALDFKLNLTGSKTARFGGQGGNVVTVNLGSGQKATLLQKDRVGTGQALSYSIKQGNSQVSSGSKAPGWGSLIDSTWGMTVASRYFWQKYPKGLAFGDDGTVSVEPAPTPEYLYVGMGTGDEILLVFHSAGDAPGASFISASPLLPRASAQQYQDSQAFYNLRSGQPPYTQMNNYIDDVTDNHLQNVSGLGVYGNINFGDTPVDYWYFDDTEVDATAWGNNYYDCNVLTPIRLFVQEGDLRYSDIFIPGARFFMETACWNPYDTTDWLAGYSPGYSGYHRSSTHFEQHYAEGIWYYYYLTGDERAREIGLRGAKAIKDEQWWGNLNVNCRMAYQRGSSVLETWKNTRNPAYLAHAKHLLVTRILDTQDQYGLIGNIDENDNIGGEQTFMMGLYSDTLWKYIKELAPNSAERQDLGARLAKIADCIDTYARKAPGQEEYWNFFDAPNNSSPPSPYKDENDSDATLYWWGKGLVAGTYAYAYDLTGLQKYKTLAVNLLNNMWTAGVIDWGGSDFWEKPSGQVMKNILHAVAIIEGAGSPPPSNSVTVTSPNGGETLTGGVNHRVTWNWSGSISVVKIEYSLNNGGSWTTITASTGNDGAYGWVPPTTASTSCLVRISDTGGSTTDTSDAVFTITTSSPGGTISLDRTILNFNGSVSNLTTGPQQVTITASDAGIDWTVSESVSWASVSPSSGTGSGSFTVSADLSSLAVGTYTGTITVTAAGASNSPQTVTVNAYVSDTLKGKPPFGLLSTPTDGAAVEGSIAVTGWSLDDTEVVNVRIYNGSDFIGNAVFVEGARPDIAKAYPGYPFNTRAGWGYMLLTNFLPNQGNGTYVINAIARDSSGNEVLLGSKTIVCDNANAVKPFGAIDTPTQGGNAAGGTFLNWGWALTPQPAAIPADGSTITVWINGVPVGNPVYNLGRSDIRNLFPGYANTDGAVGYFKFDTTKYIDGVHSIAWSVSDNAGQTEGVGSRYFTINNSGSGDTSQSSTGPLANMTMKLNRITGPASRASEPEQFARHTQPVRLKKGFRLNSAAMKVFPDQDGVIGIEVKELERLEILFNESAGAVNNRYVVHRGFLKVGERLQPLPIGSTLKPGGNVFTWMPGPGFVGQYHLVFTGQSNTGELKIIRVSVNISPGS